MHDSMSNLKELQPEVKTKLASQGIRTTTQLLEHTGTQKQGSTEAAPVGRKSVIDALVPISSISQLWGVTLQPGERKSFVHL